MPSGGGVRLVECLAFAREFCLQGGHLIVELDGARERLDEVAAAILLRLELRLPVFKFLLAQAPTLFGAAALEFAHARLGFFTLDVPFVEEREALFAFPFELFHFRGRRRHGGSVVTYAVEYNRHPFPFGLGFAEDPVGVLMFSTQCEKDVRRLGFVTSIGKRRFDARDLLLRRTALVQLLVHRPLPLSGVVAVLQ